MRSNKVTFWLNLVWFLFIYWKFIVKNHLRFYWGKICSIHYLHFSFEKHVLPQVFKDFSVENLETIPSNFLSISFSEIYFSLIIIYGGSIFTLHLTWGAFSLVCVVFVFFLFFSFFFFFIYWYFRWETLTIHRIAWMGEGSIVFLFFPLPPAHEHSFSSSRFLQPLFNQSICN